MVGRLRGGTNLGSLTGGSILYGNTLLRLPVFSEGKQRRCTGKNKVTVYPVGPLRDTVVTSGGTSVYGSVISRFSRRPECMFGGTT